MKFLKLGKNKVKEHERLLLEEYNRGRILQVDGKTDNKEYFKSLENKQPEPIIEEIPSVENSLVEEKPKIKPLPTNEENEEFYKSGLKSLEVENEPTEESE